MIKIRDKINEKGFVFFLIEKINETKTWLSEKLNKSDEHLVRFSKKTEMGPKFIKSKMRKKLQLMVEKYKRS